MSMTIPEMKALLDQWSAESPYLVPITIVDQHENHREVMYVSYKNNILFYKNPPEQRVYEWRFDGIWRIEKR